MQWKIGEVTVKRVVEFESPVAFNAEAPFFDGLTVEELRKMPWLFPHFASEDGTLKLSVHALLVEGPGGLKLVVDTCVGNDKPRNMTRQRPLHRPFLEHIAEAGLPRERVNTVVCTHLHVDHVGWNTMLGEDGKWMPTFPNAKYLIGRQEYEHWIKDEDAEQKAIMADSVKPIFDSGLTQMVEMNHRISPEVRLIPTTGHTPGHVSVVIESQGETAIITGDMMHHPAQIGRPDWAPTFDSDKAAARATRKAMLKDWSDKPILIIGTHFAEPTAGHIVRNGDSFKLRV
ncbi:MAG: MBL fold metallo-hydrolase [Proteobacteria bacterium]|nr:MBL fold metallo-hydrolase [Pseudomonadota bacterium]